MVKISYALQVVSLKP